jgi:hypothetical protein
MKDFKLDTTVKINTGFIFPENYFDNFSDRVLIQLPIKESKIISFYARNKKWIYSAAALLVLALSLPLVFQMENSEEHLNAVDVENYLTLQSTISEDEIINLLEQEDIDQLRVNALHTNIKQNQIIKLN